MADVFETIRYERQPYWNENNNMGGICMIIKVDHTDKTITFAFSLCSIHDNFDKKKGRIIAKDRIEKGLTFKGHYDPKESLKDNVIRIVKEYANGISDFELPSSEKVQLANVFLRTLDDLNEEDSLFAY